MPVLEIAAESIVIKPNNELDHVVTGAFEIPVGQRRVASLDGAEVPYQLIETPRGQRIQVLLADADLSGADVYVGGESARELVKTNKIVRVELRENEASLVLDGVYGIVAVGLYATVAMVGETLDSDWVSAGLH